MAMHGKYESSEYLFLSYFLRIQKSSTLKTSLQAWHLLSQVQRGSPEEEPAHGQENDN